MAGTDSASDDTNSSLLSRVRIREENAWIELVNWIGPFVMRWCIRAGVDPSQAEDIAQEIFVRIWNSMPNFRRNEIGQSFRGWVYTITRNCIVDYYRSRDSAGPLPDQLPDRSDPSEADDLRREAIQLLVRKCVSIHGADVGFRAFHRTAVDGLTSKQAADELGLSHEAVRKHKARWSRRLRDLLEERFCELLG
ncbi:MAG: sigma-70 family RNA polymerase sigma factor [Planctomycetia bacterium]|nr:sigma-70 family RNA polymerase sigma factor [Planctomycetia bacterium]